MHGTSAEIKYKSAVISFIKNGSFQTKTFYRNEKVRFVNLTIAKLMHDTAYLAIAGRGFVIRHKRRQCF